MSKQKTDKIGRRTLIKSGALLAFTTALAGCDAPTSSTENVENSDEILESLPYSKNELGRVTDIYLDLSEDHGTAENALQVIGSHYLNKYDQPSKRENADDVIVTSLERIDLEASDDEIQRQIITTIQRDFEEDRFAIAEGWWLSAMEGHLSSIVFLLSEID